MGEDESQIVRRGRRGNHEQGVLNPHEEEQGDGKCTRNRVESQNLQYDLSERARPLHHGGLSGNRMASRLAERLVGEALWRCCQGTDHHDHHLEGAKTVVSGIIMVVFIEFLASNGAQWWFMRFKRGCSRGGSGGFMWVPASARRALPGCHFGTKCERNTPALTDSEPRRRFRRETVINAGRKEGGGGC